MEGLVEKDETEALDDAAANGVLALPEVEPAETPDAFLAVVSKTLKVSVNVDADLASILSDHLLTVTPHANAVANAKAAIVALAMKRAASAVEQANA
ncbi:hypothetical protein [Pararhodobacter sp.]|uniref:hypothetical protein n=1 Tax=Pararhodobacter sp. TaxID=2127056 RepID=UPI002FDDB8FD